MDSYLEMICSTFHVEPGLVFINVYKSNPEEVVTRFFEVCNLDTDGKVDVEYIPERVLSFCKDMCYGKTILIRKFRKAAIDTDPLLGQVMNELKIKEAGKIFLLAYEYAEAMIGHEDVEEIFFDFSTLNHLGKIVQPEIPEEVATYCQDLLSKKVEYSSEPMKEMKIKFSTNKQKKVKSKWNFDL